jgi:hypothetical protein
MTPESPVIVGYEERQIVYAKDQPEYLPLSTLPVGDPLHGRRLTRWRLSWIERLRVLWSGDIYTDVMTFNKPLQPIRITVSVDLPGDYRLED